MKRIPYILILTLFIMASCGGKTSDHSGHDGHEEDTDDTNPNTAIYNEVMNVHDEIMPKMEDIYKLKKEIEEKIAASPDMVMEKKKQLEQVISNLDSASNSMMDWMHKFNPLPDSVDQEQARAYLESEMEKIKKVRDLTYDALEKAKEEKEKN
jgi:Mg2+ and Co2+ transporter CorA